MIYKLLALLLDYPTEELSEHWLEIEEMLSTLDNLDEVDKAVLETFTQWAQSMPLIKLQTNYVKTFDQSPSNALYLTHHLFEEQDRERGPALVELAEYYKSQGFEIDNGELPDYLPLVLEYVSSLEPLDARLFLQQSAHASEIIADNLEKCESPYAPLLRLVERHGRLAEIAA
jgi:nitrate reductase delta subunit